MTEAYPLQWPNGYKRTPPELRLKARFDSTFTKAVHGILHELRLLNAINEVISTDIPLRRDGLPYSGQANPKDPGAAVYFLFSDERPVVLACDKWEKIEDNLRAIEKTIEAMRGLERWGVSEMLDRAFTGFVALPAPMEKSWCQILDVDKEWPLDKIEATYRVKAKSAHPDRGGNNDDMVDLNRAIAEARAYKQKETL